MSEKIEVQAKSQKDWIEVFAYDLIIGFERTRPVMIFKDKQAKNVLPVYVSQIDAQLSAHSGIHRLVKSPHDLSLNLLKDLGYKLEKCVFVKIEHQQQIVELSFTGAEDKKLRMPAENVMSFCLQSKARFYCTLSMIKLSKELTTGTDARSNILATPDIHPSTQVPYLN